MSFLDALTHTNRGHIPVWLMRQAGRFLPTYEVFKRHHTLKELFHDPAMIVAITQLPLQSLPLDAAILFSDILTVLDGLGVPYLFEEGVGPVIDFHDIETVAHPYRHISESINRLKSDLTVPLIGFAGAPFTVTSYLIEGRTTKQFLKAKRKIFEDPAGFESLLNAVTDETIRYLDVQIDAGVDAIQLFDSWAHHLAETEFRRFSLNPMGRLVDHVKRRNIPVIVFSKASSMRTHELAELSPTALSLDWATNLPRMRRELPKSLALQGNLDPSVLYGSQEAIREAVDRIIEPMLGDPGFIFNLGHGVLPDTPFENVKMMIEYVKDRSRTDLKTA